MSRKKFLGMIFGITAAISVMILCRDIMSDDSKTTNAFLRRTDVAYVYAADIFSEESAISA